MSNIRESSVVGAATPANDEKTENIHDYIGSVHENNILHYMGPFHGNHNIAHGDMTSLEKCNLVAFNVLK